MPELTPVALFRNGMRLLGSTGKLIAPGGVPIRSIVSQHDGS
jgi:hypothetical protein